MFVLDEADEMLSRGFKDQIYEIFQKLSTNIQVNQFFIFFSEFRNCGCLPLKRTVLKLCNSGLSVLCSHASTVSQWKESNLLCT